MPFNGVAVPPSHTLNTHRSVQIRISHNTLVDFDYPSLSSQFPPPSGSSLLILALAILSQTKSSPKSTKPMLCE
ncbi:hypothetical protein DPMN_081955 [Dreissena polymorpha]|uniref:Uncharacterized protein n=1 Tax=Dreissena polymorpha TaxID=45954 RepID=A0A9D3Y9W8_DREPO|nr:hypothetical protein DPMN_081955 [Dreissena polymorpha]